MFLTDFIDETNLRQLNIYEIRVYKEGALYASHTFKEMGKVNQYSVTKAFTSAAAGLAIGDGIISPDTLLCDVLYRHLPDVYDERVEEITLRHLLTMTAGHDKAYLMPGEKERFKEKDWIKYSLSRPMSSRPGERFMYDNSSSYLISAMIESRLGEELSGYLKNRLFTPLEIEDYSWSTCPLGYVFGGSDLRMKTEDMAKIGLLFSGKYKNIIDEAYIKEARSKKADTDWGGEGSYGYGYQLWMNKKENTFRGEGALGQMCIVCPEKDVVVAINSCENRCASDNNIIYDYLWDTVIERI